MTILLIITTFFEKVVLKVLTVKIKQLIMILDTNGARGAALT
nr:MAG TPA: hypothetical protein [Caudoviricetes sp.]